MSEMLLFADLWSVIGKATSPLATESVAIDKAWGRVLATEARAAWPLPFDDNSAMDGFALRASDTQGASESSPANLRLVTGDAYARAGELPTLEAGEAAPIGTGGRIPPGADAIAQKEVCHRASESIEVLSEIPIGRHIRRRGEELEPGHLLASPGQDLHPSMIASLAVAGVTTVEVFRRPRVVILSSGDELVPIGQSIEPGQVVEVNAQTLARLAEPMVESLRIAHLADERSACLEGLREAIDGADVVLISGGMSVGDRDLVKTVLEGELGCERVFWKVAMKPGKPAYLGHCGHCTIVGLPGNPASTLVGWKVLAQPVLRRLAGQKVFAPRLSGVCLAEPIKRNEGRAVLAWGTIDDSGATHYFVPLGARGSHMLSGLAQAEALAIIPFGPGELEEGTEVYAILL